LLTHLLIMYIMFRSEDIGR